MFVAGPDELRDVLDPLVRDSAGHGRVVVAATPRVTEVARSCRTGQVTVADRSDVYDAPGRALATLRRTAQAEPGVRTTFVGEPPLPTHDPVELHEWHRWESVLADALSGTGMRVVCVHDTAALPASAHRPAQRTHPALLTRHGPRPNPDYEGPVTTNAADVPGTGPHQQPVRALDIRSDLATIRAGAGEAAAELGLPAGRVEDLTVAVNELTANVLEHGAGKGTVSLYRAGPRLVCDVFDESGGLTDPLAGYRATEAGSTSGYGLWIARQVCDFLEVSGGTHGSRVRAHFRL
ncbi:anti-sigma regulatory factor (Ser/Thr protein kinase) [Haloactinospora alba]|uniref:Anti-sigma regulatory factor (Ser/Thr protein kinase) n=1 Tax=Haloactinospora alba TaxID=405555 RepID=A0A543N7G4_9ACTN|nr:anti-sigma factor RsbA family regulatory protein [Haloactinospora alba]TQN27748.1 anti-sigma regulatory factor (Ser/Thr protein kinase) [Haloactinospora alba]